MFRFWRSLHFRVLLVVALALAIMLAGMAALALQAVNDSTQRTLDERLLLARAIAGRVDDRLAESGDLVRVMIDAEALDPSNAPSSQQQSFVASMRAHFSGLASFVAVIDEAQKVVAVDPPTPQTLNYDFAHADCVHRAFETQKTAIGCVAGLDSAAPAVALVVPVLRGPDTRGAVFVALDLNAANFTELLEPLGLGSTGVTEIVNLRGTILGASRPELRGIQDDHAGHFGALIQAQEASVGTCHRCHSDSAASGGALSGPRAVLSSLTPPQDDIIAFAPLHSAQWGVVVRQSQAEAFSFTADLWQRMAIFGALTLAVASLSTLALTRRIVRPLGALTSACQAIERGNLESALPPDRPDEIGTLTRALDRMRSRLRASLAETEHATRNLEERIRERTFELETSRAELLLTNRDLSTLNALGDAMRQPADLNQRMRLAVEQVSKLDGVHDVSLCLFDQGQPQLVRVAQCALRVKRDCESMCPVVRPVIEQAFQARHAQLVEIPYVLGPDQTLIRAAPDSAMGIVCVPLGGKNKRLGMLTILPVPGYVFPAMQLDLLTLMGIQIGTAMENALLIKELREKEEARGELLRKVIAAQEEERRRIARELHDESSQSLTALSVGLETVILSPGQSADDLKKSLRPLKDQSTRMLSELQRMIRDLRPSLLDDLGLIPALDWYAEFRLQSAGVGVTIEVVGSECRLPTEIETTLFRIGQEAISNIARHAEAEHVSIVLEFGAAEIALEVEDDGQGFDPDAKLTDGRAESYGLLGMQERVNLIGGKLLLESKPGQGTRVRAEIPLHRVELKSHGNIHHPSLVG